MTDIEILLWAKLPGNYQLPSYQAYNLLGFDILLLVLPNAMSPAVSLPPLSFYLSFYLYAMHLSEIKANHLDERAAVTPIHGGRGGRDEHSI